MLFTNSETPPSLMQNRSGFVAIHGSDLDRLTAEDFTVMRQCGNRLDIPYPA
jgi:hypothetical protein